MNTSVQQIIRFLIAGVCVAFFNLSLLYLFTEYFHIWYLVGSVMAYICAVLLNFVLQKFWVFKTPSYQGVRRQFTLYIFVSLGYLALNTVSMYVLVDYLGVQYLISQACITLVLSVINYIINNAFVFKANV